MPWGERGDHETGFGSGMTFVDHRRPDGLVVRWESRHHRKHLAEASGSTWWAPGARSWWIAVLFAVGSLLFALGSWTLVGAVCFFAGAVLLLPERTEKTSGEVIVPGDGPGLDRSRAAET
jgi:hypothetical protein